MRVAAVPPRLFEVACKGPHSRRLGGRQRGNWQIKQLLQSQGVPWVIEMKPRVHKGGIQIGCEFFERHPLRGIDDEILIGGREIPPVYCRDRSPRATATPGSLPSNDDFLPVKQRPVLPPAPHNVGM